MARSAVLPTLFLCLLAATPALAQELELQVPTSASDPELAASMKRLAQQALAVQTDTARETYLDNRFRLEMMSGQLVEAGRTLAMLRELRQTVAPARVAASIPYEVYLGALSRQATSGLPFADAFQESYRAVVGGLDDRTAAYQVPWAFGTSIRRLEGLLQASLDQQNGRSTISLPDAVDAVRRYLALEVFRSFQSFIADLETDQDRRRYVVEKDIRVRTPDGATICVLVVRPRLDQGRLPALLNFTIYADTALRYYEARRSASNGYVGVGALTRGKGCSPDTPVPIEHDGADAAAVIDWISQQPWSDGRVGMFGGSYDGFTQWAAAKHQPKALKAIMPSVTFAPGVDFPMDGNVFMTYAYPWPFYTTNVKGLDNATYFDAARWQRLTQDWYVSGRAYRDLEAIDGTPNPIFGRWRSHPGYDAYWQSAIPYKEEFARITIPVLTTTGYYDSGQIGALYYFTQHQRYAPGTEQYLVIGPYDHVGGQRGTMTPLGSTTDVLRGYRLDQVAHLDIGELRYQWFDYVFKGSPKPALLEARVNYEVMGANSWRHAPSIEAMADEQVRFHLSDPHIGDGYVLRDTNPVGDAFVTQTIDLADRSDVLRMGPGGDLIDQALDDWSIISRAPRIGNAIEFVSAPFTRPTEISGRFSGRLSVVTNKADFDFSVTLFELTPRGEYFQLSYYWARASYVEDRSSRRLLTPGKRQWLDFVSGRLTSRKLEPGSRLVVVIGIIKQSGEQINYGTGKDVSEETIADAKEPLEVRWYSESYVDVPVRR